MDAAGKISVLLVDDRPEKLLALEAILADLPLNLVRAYSGRDALRCLLQQEYAAILLDVNMPGMDGFDTAQLIRQRKSNEHTPIIFVTAQHDELFMSRGYSLGAVDYILQPVVPEVLRSKVSVFVDLYRKNKIVREQAIWQRQRAMQLQKLASASVQINAARSMARTLQIITDSARDLIGSHQAITLFIMEGDSDKPETRAFSSFSDKYADWHGRPMQLDAAATSVIATSRSASRLSAAQLRSHPDWGLLTQMRGEIPPVAGLLAAPLIGREGRNVGVIFLSDKVTGEFTADDEAILVQLAQMATVAIENILSSEAREANRAKDQFIAVLSHELRTPLTPVLALLSGFQRDERLPAEMQDELKIVRRNVELEARLIDDLLDLTRISKGKIELHLETLNANELLREAANICQSELAEKSIELVIDLQSKRPYVKGDATRLQQAFWNLLKNAVKFTPAKGRIMVESLDQENATFCARITDTGIGIEPDVLPRIFHAFEQGRTAITRQFGGLGLGLAISKALVELHHGTLVAASAGRGKGATFTITMPITPEEPKTSAFPTPRLAPAAPPRENRVLLVEDHRDTARVMAKLLRSNSYVVDAASSVTEATQLLKDNRYSILVSDIGLPDGSGLDLVRTAQAIQPIPAIALSGFGMEHDIRRSKEAGFAEHLTKPLNFQLLIDAIERLTAGSEEGSAGALAAG
ncbi:MAG TPA: response regulator [Phycisphaerae bacterium]|nr:response regulator [Phycisphaerae bacterium]